MKVKIWDNHNKQWLQPMTITFSNGNVVRVTAMPVGPCDPLAKGWYDIHDEDLKKVNILVEGELT